MACTLTVSTQAQKTAQPNTKTYVPFSLGELKPSGWLKEWAQKAANGMTKTMGIDFTEFVRGVERPQSRWVVALRADGLLHRRFHPTGVFA